MENQEQTFDTTESFEFNNGSYLEVEFAKRLDELEIPYHARQSMSPAVLFPLTHYHVPTHHLQQAKEIYWTVQNESLLNSSTNQLNRLKEMGRNEESVPPSISYMANIKKFRNNTLLAILSMILTLYAFYIGNKWTGIPLLLLFTYLLYKIYKGQYVKRLVMDSTKLQLDDVQIKWTDIIYLDKVDESVKLQMHIINITLAKGEKYKIAPSMFGLDAEDLINTMGMYYRKHI